MVITARKPTRPITIKRVSSTSPQKAPLETVARRLPSQTSQKSVHKSLDRRVSKKLSLKAGKAMMQNLSSIDSEFEGTAGSGMNLTQIQE